MIIGKSSDGIAIQYASKEYADADGIPTAVFDSIPEGTGILKTDLKTLWWEELPTPYAPEPTEEEKQITLLKAQLQAATERSDFVEDCIADMATKVYT